MLYSIPDPNIYFERIKSATRWLHPWRRRETKSTLNNKNGTPTIWASRSPISQKKNPTKARLFTGQVSSHGSGRYESG